MIYKIVTPSIYTIVNNIKPCMQELSIYHFYLGIIYTGLAILVLSDGTPGVGHQD